MGVQLDNASKAKQPQEDLGQIEKRDSQLWWLAILIVVLLTITVTAIDMFPLAKAVETLGIRVGSLSSINGVTVRLSLLVSLFLICTYFRECTRNLLHLNRRLLSDIDDQKAIMSKKNVELARMKQLSEVLMTQQDLASALEIALQMATEVVGADRASIMLLDDESQTLSIVAAKGLPDDVVRDTRIKVGQGLAGLVAQQGEPLILNNDDLDDTLRAMAHRTDRIRSAVITPIKVDGRVRGVINVTDRRDGGNYTRDDLNTISTLAQQASMVIQKIELYDNLKQQVTMLSEALDQLHHTQAELIQSERLACIGQLAGGVAHEINNPLHIMLGRAELLLEAMPDGSSDRRNAQILCDQVERLAKVVKNLLSFSRRDRQRETDTADINSIVGQTLELIEQQMTCNNIKVSFRRDNSLPPLTINAGEMQQVFLNMMLNAFQAMKPTGGELEIVTRANDGNVEVIFSDSGPGIPDENVPRIFEPFFSTKPEGEGSGLGLSVSYGIVQAHGGQIEVESSSGLGARFTISLPLPQAVLAA